MIFLIFMVSIHFVSVCCCTCIQLAGWVNEFKHPAVLGHCSNTYTFLNYCYVVHIREAVEAFSETVCHHYPPQEHDAQYLVLTTTTRQIASTSWQVGWACHTAAHCKPSSKPADLLCQSYRDSAGTEWEQWCHNSLHSVCMCLTGGQARALCQVAIGMPYIQRPFLMIS